MSFRWAKANMLEEFEGKVKEQAKEKAEEEVEEKVGLMDEIKEKGVIGGILNRVRTRVKERPLLTAFKEDKSVINTIRERIDARMKNISEEEKESEKSVREARVKETESGGI